MNSFSQNRSMIYKQSFQGSRNLRPQWSSMQRRNYFNSSFPSHTIPGSEKYWCETCDKGYMTNALLNYHTRSHQRCNIDGCQFVAHPRVITKHIQMQHATGLYKRIGKLNNPEEIKKWREERKRKYPTKENIEKRQAEMKEKIRRGEKMGLKYGTRRINNVKSGYNNRQQKHTYDRNNRKINGRNITSRLVSSKKRIVKNKEEKVTPVLEETRKLQPFKGIQDLLADDSVEEETPEVSNNLIEDDDMTVVEIDKETITKPNLCGALTSLMCNYESSEEEEMEEKAKTAPVNTTNNLNTNVDLKNNDKDIIVSNEIKKSVDENKAISTTNNQSKNTPNESENESGPEETSVVKVSNTNEETKPVKHVLTKKERLQKLEKAKRRVRTVNFKKKLPSTLLEKLLHKEILHERNVILQCVRYVVENKYFDKD